MSPTSLPIRRLRATAVLPRRTARLQRLRVKLGDGARTTLHVAAYARDEYLPRVVSLDDPQPLVRWCRATGERHALVGGFFLRSDYSPLGELRVDGNPRPSIPFDEPWGPVRACLQVDRGVIRIGRRDQLPARPSGDLLQAGPLLIARGERAVFDDRDAEGFSAGAHQFDSDITAGRYPRAAFGVTAWSYLAVACDGRGPRDAGMTLGELADALLELGVTDALNLDGGGSASLVHEGRLRNFPRECSGADLIEGRPVVSALVFAPR